MLYEQFPELKFKYRNREFWCKGYYVDTAGKNAKKIQEYEEDPGIHTETIRAGPARRTADNDGKQVT